MSINKIIQLSLGKIIFIFLLVVATGFNQLNRTGAWFLSSLSGENNQVQTGCWEAPSVPVLVSPANNSYAGLGSAWDLNPVMDWQDSTSTCPQVSHIQYQYELYNDQTLTNLVYRSEWLDTSSIAASGTPEGIYYWRVRSRDEFNHISNFSNSWKLVVDRTAPVVKIENLHDGDRVDRVVQVYGTVTDANPHHYWLVIENGSGAMIAGPGVVNETNSFTNQLLLTWNTASLPEGNYTIKLEARDAANNKQPNASADLNIEGDSVDWAAVIVDHKPSVPILESPIDDVVINDNTPLMQWSNSTDPSGIHGYYYRVYIGSPSGPVWPNTTGLFVAVSQLQAGLTANGNYYWQVRAEDNNGNLSDWSELEHFTIDTGAPVTTLITVNSPERTIKEDVLNGDFNEGVDGLDHWVKNGEVSVVHQESFDTDDISGDDLIINPPNIPEPGDNQHMAVIKPSLFLSGTDFFDGYDVYYSMVSQPIPNSAKTLSFWYNFLSSDTIGFDNPGFSVYLNNQEIYQIWAADVYDPAKTISSTGWQKFNYDISKIDKGINPILTLVFYAGNKEDNTLDSWVYLDKITTADIVVSGATKLYLNAVDSYSTPTIYYKLSGCSIAGEQEYTYGSYPSGIGLSLTEPTLNNKFCYWSKDKAGSEETKHELTLLFDSQAPSTIANLAVGQDLGNGSVILDWTASTDDNNNGWVSEYDVRYSTATISATTNWNSLNKVTGLRAPRKPGETETVTASGLTVGIPYWFSVKSADAGPSWSAMSNVVTNGPLVVLNEIMYNPVGDENASMPNGEWVELYNNADYDIDVVGWQIRDNNGHTIIVSTSNSDNNLNTTDGGETIVPQHAWLTVYRNGSAIFNNTGDTVSLYNNSHLIDSYTYSDTKGDGFTVARHPDGIGSWVDPLATPGRKNAVTQADLIAQIKIWQQDSYNAKIGIFDALNYNQANCDIYYNHLKEGITVEENIKKTITIDSLEEVVSDIYFGTESKGVYTPHQNITDVSLECKLLGKDGHPDSMLTIKLNGAWY